MTRFAHCNRIFAFSPHCSGVVSRALHCVLIAASPVQFVQAVLVGLALRRQDANATRNILQVVRKKEAVIVSIWKRAWVHKLNTMALIVETLHVANAFIFNNVLPIHVFVPSDDGCFCARRLTARQACVPAYRSHIVGFACYFDRACVQISVYEVQHFHRVEPSLAIASPYSSWLVLHGCGGFQSSQMMAFLRSQIDRTSSICSSVPHARRWCSLLL